MFDRTGCGCSICHNSYLRDRIAAALRNIKGDVTFEAMADAVILELDLRPDTVGRISRWVTDWEVNDV